MGSYQNINFPNRKLQIDINVENYSKILWLDFTQESRTENEFLSFSNKSPFLLQTSDLIEKDTIKM